jgi:RND family efflux transporter MFP subunit
MHPQVLQDKPGACPICGMQLTPVRQETGKAGGAGEQKVRYWWDPMMNPPHISDKPGKSPMGMDLVPVYEDEVRAGPAVTIDPAMTQNIGVRVAAVAEGPLVLTLRTVGYLREAESHQHDISLKVDGWIERLHANTEGMAVRKGDPLFDLYSPEVLVAHQELLGAHRALSKLPAAADESVRAEAALLVEGARQKLALWNVPAESVEDILRTGQATGRVTFRSPADGYVAEKAVVPGSAVEARMKLLRIIDPSLLWIDAQVFESQLSYVMRGQKARAVAGGTAGETFEGEVIFVSPQLNPATRSATARLAVSNPEGKLKAGQFVTVEFTVEASPRAILVPREAVIDTGTRRIAFVALEAGHFEPRLVRAGAETGDGRIQVLAGLAPGERVVISGQFLLDSESRLREAIEKMTRGNLLKPPPGNAAPPSSGHAPSKARSDPVLGPYWEMAAELAGDRPVAASTVDRLVQASRALGDVLAPVERAAESMRGKPLKEQRDDFKKVSAALIAVLDHVPATSAMGPKLYIVHCPMAEAGWVQKTDEISNPYYGSEMHECGEVIKTVDTVRP